MENRFDPLGYSDGDVDTNRTQTQSLESLVADRYSRRQTLTGGAAVTAAVLGTGLLSACGSDDPSAPIVTAGANVVTSAGRIVTITASVSDVEGITGSTWTQISGPEVVLTTSLSNASFLAPAVTGPTDLRFRLTVTNAKGATTSVETLVTVMTPTIGFEAVAKNRNDVVTVPAGYSVQIGARLGDPIATGIGAYANDGSDANFAQRIGDHGDALYWYGLSASGTRDDNSSTRGLIVQNHENITQMYLHPAGATSTGGVRPEAEAIKEIECHGLSVVEYRDSGSRNWSYVQASAFNRRITPNTPVVFNGPVRGSALLRTVFSPTGTEGRGTINNCANGYTPWATLLTCEENWAGYFRRSGDNAARTAKELTALSRYGVTSSTGGYGWSTVVPADATNTTFRRWDARATGADALADFRNEPNQFGWVVELDPYDKTLAPRKRTALGRFNHEGCWPGKFVAGRKPAFYMGDDARREYIYKFVSATAWSDGDAGAANRVAMGDKYLDNGTLYVAKFNADGSGTWMPLVFGTGPLTAANPTYAFADQADVLTNCRLAADALGATPMDRPEWTAVNPATGEIFCTLTNNSASGRPLTGTDAANPRHYNDPFGAAASAQFGNPNGHIVRMREASDNSEATTFTWDIYLFGAAADANATNVNLSGLTDANDFSSPDGLWFGRAQNASGVGKPVLWVQTDDGAFTDVTNCMMLLGQPGSVGDGSTKTITNTGSGGTTASQSTRVGAAATLGNLRRFLVGPIDCEITGVDTTPDGRTLFVGIQHPGDSGTPSAPSGHWPASQATGTAGATVRPRSAIAIITKNDGGVVGL